MSLFLGTNKPIFFQNLETSASFILCQRPILDPNQKNVRNVRAHREMVINIERTGFVVLARIVTNDFRSKISRFKRNMPAYESVLSDFKT